MTAQERYLRVPGLGCSKTHVSIMLPVQNTCIPDNLVLYLQKKGPSSSFARTITSHVEDRVGYFDKDWGNGSLVRSRDTCLGKMESSDAICQEEASVFAVRN